MGLSACNPKRWDRSLGVRGRLIVSGRAGIQDGTWAGVEASLRARGSRIVSG